MDVFVRVFNDVENGGGAAIHFTVYNAPSKEAAISMVKEKYPGYQFYEGGEIVDVDIKNFWNKQPSYVKRDGKSNWKEFWGKKNKKI